MRHFGYKEVHVGTSATGDRRADARRCAVMGVGSEPAVVVRKARVREEGTVGFPTRARNYCHTGEASPADIHPDNGDDVDLLYLRCMLFFPSDQPFHPRPSGGPYRRRTNPSARPYSRLRHAAAVRN